MRRLAILAHFDPDQCLDGYLRPLVKQLARDCDRVLIVSTSGIDRRSFDLPGNIEIHVRDNIGYDFSSFRAGLMNVTHLWHYDELLLLNDSFYAGERFDIKSILEHPRIANADIWGITQNNQFAPHLQSYFIGFRRRAFVTRWFSDFWLNVVPLRDKFDLIYMYEIGLSTSARRAGLRCAPVYVPSIGARLRHTVARFRAAGALKGLRESLTPVNPTHCYWRDLFDRLSLVKVDVLRLGLCDVGVSDIFGGGEIQRLVVEHLDRTGAFYRNRRLDGKPGRVLAGGERLFDCVVGEEAPRAEVAVVLHLYYPDLLPEIIEYLRNVALPFDIFVSVPHGGYVAMVRDTFCQIANRTYVFRQENRGRDVAPFIRLLQEGVFEKYTCVCKLHSKKSNYSGLGATWRKRIMGPLLPSVGEVLRICKKFANDPGLGVVAPFECFLSNEKYWGANEERVREYARKMGLPDPEIDLFFVGGTMFWFSPKALLPLRDALGSEHVFEDELGQQDGTLAHVVERLTCLSARAAGMRVAPIERLDVQVTSSDVHENRVIVLE